MRFIKYFLLVLIICISFLSLIFVFYRKGYNNYYTFEQTKLKQIFEEKEYYDALFIGSSRTLYHVNPKIIDSVLNLKSFNAGIGGANLLEMSMILKGYLASHPAPKYVIADLATTAFDIKTQTFFNPNIYFPFLHNKIVFNTFRPYKRVNLLRWFPFLQITESDEKIKQGVLQGLVGKEEPLEPTYKGYIESGTDTIALPFKVYYLTTYFSINREAITLFEEIIDICKKNKIRLFITYAPVYNHASDKKLNPLFFPTLKNICDTSHTPFLNYRYLSSNNDNRLFRDELHLNKYGADIFTNLLARDLKKIEAGENGNSNNQQKSRIAGLERNEKTIEAMI